MRKGDNIWNSNGCQSKTFYYAVCGYLRHSHNAGWVRDCPQFFWSSFSPGGRIEWKSASFIWIWWISPKIKSKISSLLSSISWQNLQFETDFASKRPSHSTCKINTLKNFPFVIWSGVLWRRSSLLTRVRFVFFGRKSTDYSVASMHSVYQCKNINYGKCLKFKPVLFVLLMVGI